MSASVRRDTVAGFETVVLENDRLHVSIIPALGGRIWDLTDRISGRQWIWHREDVPLAFSAVGSIYDDRWAGGWEELFPNDAPTIFEGRVLPDHGEWWTTAWTVAEISDGPEAVVRLTAETRIRRAFCTKEFRLLSGADTVRVAYRIESLEPEAFHFLFKQHLPIAVTEACELAIPGGQVTTVDPDFSTMLADCGPFSWPLGNGKDVRDVDVRQISPRSSKEREFVYITEVPAGCCGVDDLGTGASIRMRYDNKKFPYLWLFLSYGGWRDCYTAVLEPCTNMPKHLARAVRAGQSARLEAAGVFETSVAVTASPLGGRD